MISDGKKPNFAAVAKLNREINKQECTNSRVPSCGHDFWEEAKKMDFGDVILCNRCGVYYAKIKHLPWVVEYKPWLTNKVVSHHTNHLSGAWFTPITARVTD